MIKAPFQLAGHNPDVLTCIANLSNDEVFTPPEFANQMLDTLEQSWASSNNGENIWSKKDVTFLDPCTKSGVFLREIVKRLNLGLTKEIPDLTERINHILTKQVFGIGITQLTSLLARRSLYCSKNANGKYSIAREFESNQGNIWFTPAEHVWVDQNCKFCGANKSEYKRAIDLESHAYTFIHSSNIKVRIAELFGEQMHFDVIIGNPPYQLGDSGFGASARPIYQLFVNQAKSLDPRFLCMVIPARWFAGGKGLDDFRISMLSDTRIRVLHDYLDSSAIFKGTNIEGGVCYFLWDRDNHGDPTIFTHDEDGRFEKSERPLLESESDIYIRYSKGIEILRKVFSIENTGRVEKSVFKLPLEKKFSQFISARKPFGIPTDFRGAIKKFANSVKIFQNGGTAYIDKSKIKAGHDLVKNWKVFVPYARGGSQFPNVVIGKPIIGEPNSVCSETYLSIGPFASEQIAENVCSYMSTRLFRLLVLLRKSSQHVTRGVYDFVPLLDFSEVWTDEKLYERYGIAKDEIAFIERMIRPMDLDGE